MAEVVEERRPRGCGPDAGDGDRIGVVCTMGTPECDAELHLFLACVRAHHPRLPVVVGCSSAMCRGQRAAGAFRSAAYAAFGADERIAWIPCLDVYGASIRRAAMEAEPGTWFPTRHTDFMMEKANLMDHAMRVHRHRAVAFLDCDVFLLRELPRIPPEAQVALSPHAIHPVGEALWGRYNGGFVVARDPRVLADWRQHALSSRFYDQAALEPLAERYRCHLLPPQCNYGYWRMMQPPSGDPREEAKLFSIRPDPAAGTQQPPPHTIFYRGEPLQSIHTHLLSTDRGHRNMVAFNRLIIRWLRECSPANRLYRTAFRCLV